jgi:hypothetical protein
MSVVGLDISQGCYSGSGAIFDQLRLVWAQAAGYGLMDLTDRGGPIMPRIPFNEFTQEDMLGEWPEGAPDDPLLILLVHQERAGRIKTSHCHYLADRLEQLESVMIKEPAMLKWLLLTQQFVRGLRAAAHYAQDVVFS